MSAPRLAWLAWITVCVIWGTTYLAIRVALETVPVALVAGLRWTTAGLILGAVLCRARPRLCRASRGGRASRCSVS